MTNLELAWQLHKIGDLLELTGAQHGLIDDFKNSAELILGLRSDVIEDQAIYPQNISQFPEEVRIALQEMLEKDKSSMLTRLERQIPAGLIQILDIPKMTGKMAYLIYKRLGIKDVRSLEVAAKKRELRKLPGMGSKTEQSIIRGIKLLRETPDEVPIGVAAALGEEFLANLKKHKLVKEAVVVGQVRMVEEMVSKILIIFAAKDANNVFDTMKKHPKIKEVYKLNCTEMIFRTRLGVLVEFKAVNIENFGGYSHFFTGTQEYLAAMKVVFEQYGLNISNLDSYSFKSEAELFRKLNMQYIEPELRNSIKYVQLAVEGKLPPYLAKEHIRGDLHCHTDWSDGVSKLEEMVNEAAELGYDYLAITDHSQSLQIAKGLSAQYLIKQGEIISQLNQQLEDFTVLKGIEADILQDGELDYDDQILEEMDIVIASVHTNFQMDKATMTDRITTAIKNPLVNILGHPTGRILGRRNGYQVDLDEVIEVAAATNTVLEINSSPDRLDLNAEYAAKAQDAGVKLAINTDSHGVFNLTDIGFGLAVANKAGLKAENIINTYDTTDLIKFLSNHKA